MLKIYSHTNLGLAEDTFMIIINNFMSGLSFYVLNNLQVSHFSAYIKVNLGKR